MVSPQCLPGVFPMGPDPDGKHTGSPPYPHPCTITAQKRGEEGSSSFEDCQGGNKMSSFRTCIPSLVLLMLCAWVLLVYMRTVV